MQETRAHAAFNKNPWVKCYNFDDAARRMGGSTGMRPQKLVLVWVIRYFEWFTWLEEELQLLYSAPAAVKAAFQILVFVTQPGDPDPDSWADAQVTAGAEPSDPPPRLDKVAKQVAFLCHKHAVQETSREHCVSVVLEGGRPKWPAVLERVLTGKT